MSHLLSFRVVNARTRRLLSYSSRSLCSELKGTAPASPSKSAQGGRVSAAVGQSNRIHSQIDPSSSQSDIDKKKNIKDSITAPRGTRDFYPDDHRLQSWLFDKWRAVAASYGFEQYDAPILESEELYIRKAGEDVTQQLYNFTDKGGRRISLRPEMTPSLARMILARKNALSMPLKWFAIPQCWRYERMTRGRRREHYQWNMDIIGVDDVSAEAELLAAAVDSMRALGLTAQDVGIKVNSRKILTGLMSKHGVAPQRWVATCVLLDKMDRWDHSSSSSSGGVGSSSSSDGGNKNAGEETSVSGVNGTADAYTQWLSDGIVTAGIGLPAFQNLLSDCSASRDLDAIERTLGAHSEGVRDLRTLFSLAQAYGFQDWLIFDPTVVRGLAYYTGVVFEGFDRAGKFRAIFGGGRYNNLLGSISSGDYALQQQQQQQLEDTANTDASMEGRMTYKNDKTAAAVTAAAAAVNVPAVGFGFGDAVIVELLQSLGKLPAESICARSDVDVVLFALQDAPPSSSSTAVGVGVGVGVGQPSPTAGEAASASPSASTAASPQILAVICATELRRAGHRVDLVLLPRKPKWVLPRADKMGARVVVIVGGGGGGGGGGAEGSRCSMSVKDLRSKSQVDGCDVDRVLELVKNAVSQSVGPAVD